MTDQTIAAELRSLRETVLTLCQYIGPRLTREQVCQLSHHPPIFQHRASNEHRA